MPSSRHRRLQLSQRLATRAYPAKQALEVAHGHLQHRPDELWKCVRRRIVKMAPTQSLFAQPLHLIRKRCYQQRLCRIRGCVAAARSYDCKAKL